MSAYKNLDQKQHIDQLETAKVIHFKDYSKKIYIPNPSTKKVNIFSILENNLAKKKSSQLIKMKICGSIIALSAVALYFSLV